MEMTKPVHSIILDSSPLLINQPSISTLLAKSEKLYTVPLVLSEIKDKNARDRLEVTVLPFLTVRSPNLASVNVATDFARTTGDLAILSKPDLQILALAYELECELNHGDWRLRSVPGQKRLNGSPPPKHESSTQQYSAPKESAQKVGLDRTEQSESPRSPRMTQGQIPGLAENLEPAATSMSEDTNDVSATDQLPDLSIISLSQGERSNDPTSKMSSLGSGITSLDHDPIDASVEAQMPEDDPESDSVESDSDGWITPTNIKKQQAKDQILSTASDTSIMQVATITTDFAIQNVLLQMNLNLLSPSMLRIQHLRYYILRCHACFEKTKDMMKQFCPRCGKPTLTRVACSTSAGGKFKIYLKKNMQWNSRGDRFSIPKPVPGAANGKIRTGKGGGKGGWGQELILAEDQKEYVQATTRQNRNRERNLMDEDYLPGILTGDRTRPGGRPKVGGGKNVNSRKR